MTRRLLRMPGHATQLSLMGAGLVILAYVSEIKVRRRDPALGLEGVIDGAILVELAVWCLAGMWIAHWVFREREWVLSRFPAALGRNLRLLTFVAILILFQGMRAGVGISLVRAIQFVVLVTFCIIVWRETSRPEAQWLSVWRGYRRMLVVGACLLVGADAVLSPLMGFEDASTWQGFSRYQWFATHPIATGTCLGLAVIGVTSAWFGTKDRLLQHLGMPMIGLGLGAFLWATKARGPIGATVLALLVLVGLSSRRRAQAAASLLGTGLLGLLVAGIADSQLSAVVIRGQTREQLTGLSGRTELFEYAWELVSQNFLFGHGYLAARGAYLEQFPWAGESHNGFVDIAVSMGLVGLIAYAVLMLCCGVLFARGLRSCDATTRAHSAEGSALLVFLIVNGMTTEGFGGTVGLEVVMLAVVAISADQVDRRLRGRVSVVQAAG